MGSKIIGIVGLGLLGSSLAESIRRNAPSYRIVGISSQHTIEEALNDGLIEKGYDYSQMDRVLQEVDYFILCTPITHIMETLSRWQIQLPQLKKPVLVSDVGSTKEQICNLGSAIRLKNPDFHWVGSHPMAGSEKRGISSRSPHLFENAPWIFCPQNEDEEKSASKWEFLVAELKALPLRLTPDIHDKAVAKVSHLPQLISTALTGYLLSTPKFKEDALQVAGRGFRDMTRLSHSALSVWEPIFKTNHTNILHELEGLHAYIGQITQDFRQENYTDFFAKGNDWTENEKAPWKASAPGEPTEIRVTCPDIPGQLAKILAPLSGRGINVQDVEVLKNRENEKGTIRIILSSPGAAKEAIEILTTHKFEAKYP